MLSSLLFLATAATEHGEDAGGGITRLMQDFGISIPGIVAQALSFSIVAYILYRFGFKPVMATLDERQKRIADGLKHAEEMQVKLAAAAEESAQIVRKASLDAQKIIDEARKSAKDFTDKQQAEAVQHAADLLTKAQQAIELEHKKMIDQARGEIARLVVVTTERVLAKQLSDNDRRSYNDAATRELTAP